MINFLVSMLVSQTFLRFFPFSGELQRKVGLKALETGGNAVLGWAKKFWFQFRIAAKFKLFICTDSDIVLNFQ